jgi:hypothetical protein
MKKLLRLSLLPFALLILHTGNSFAQSAGNQQSFFVSYERQYIETNQMYDQVGPASFFNTSSRGFRFYLGYSIEFKKLNQLTFQAGFGMTDYGFGVDIKSNQYPEIRDRSISSDYISGVGNGSVGIAYSRKILNRNCFSLAITGGFDLFIQGGSVLISNVWSKRANTGGTLPPVTPDTVYGRYNLTSLRDKRINFTPTVTANTDVSYLITNRSRVTLGIGYRHAFSDFAGGDYELFATSASKSSGKWRLRGNAVCLSVGYHYLLKKRKR